MTSPSADSHSNPLAALQRRARNGLVIQGVLALLIGVIMVVWPGASLQVFAWLMAAWLIVNGILGLGAWLRGRTTGGRGRVSDLTLAQVKRARLKGSNGALTRAAPPTLGEALDAAGIEIPFPHQVAVPYGDADHDPIDAPVARKAG